MIAVKGSWEGGDTEQLFHLFLGDERLKPEGLDACLPGRPQARRTEEGLEILLSAQPPLVSIFDLI